MKPLDPTLAAAVPELVVLDILGAMIESTIIALLAAHPRLQHGDHPARWCSPEAPSTCCRADAIIDLLYQLDDAIIAYLQLLDVELAEPFDPPF